MTKARKIASTVATSDGGTTRTNTATAEARTASAVRILPWR
jgi:hypothetical protein